MKALLKLEKEKVMVSGLIQTEPATRASSKMTANMEKAAKFTKQDRDMKVFLKMAIR